MKTKQIATQTIEELKESYGTMSYRNSCGKAEGLITAWRNELEWLKEFFGEEFDLKLYFDNMIYERIQDLTESIKLLEGGLK